MVLLLSHSVPAPPLLGTDLWNGPLDLDTGPQLRAQGPKSQGDRLDVTVYLLSPPLLAVQLFPPVRQGVDLRLQRILQHVELCGAVDAVGLEEAKLGRVSVQLRDFLSDAEGQGLWRLGDGGLRMPRRYR